MPERAADPERAPRRATRPTAGASPTPRCATALRAVEALPRRHALAHLGLHAASHDDRANPAAGGTLQRPRPEVDRRHGLLPLRPRRRVQPVFAYDPRSQEREAAHASFDDFPVLDAGRRRRQDRLRAGRLPAPLRSSHGGEPRAAEGRRADRPARDPAALREGRRSTSATRTLSPSGARAVFEFRGEIVTVPAEKGDPRNLTNTPGGHERSPAWSPDGKRSPTSPTRAASTQLHVAPQDGKGDGRRGHQLDGAGFYADPLVARQQEARLHRQLAVPLLARPGRAARRRRSRRPRSTGRPTRSRVGWSPDSKWLAYTVNTQALAMTAVRVFDRQRRSFRSPTA